MIVTSHREIECQRYQCSIDFKFERTGLLQHTFGKRIFVGTFFDINQKSKMRNELIQEMHLANYSAQATHMEMPLQQRASNFVEADKWYHKLDIILYSSTEEFQVI